MNQDPHQRDETQLLKSEDSRLAAIRQNSILRRVININYYLVGALEILLLLRFLLRLFRANPENQIANFIYSLSTPFVAPFQNLFPEPLEGLEINTLFAIAVYALLGWLVAQFIWLIWSQEV